MSLWAHKHLISNHALTRHTVGFRDGRDISAHLPHPGVQQQVVRFDVSVDEAQLVDGVDGQDRLCDVELRGLFGQSVLLHQQGHHVAWQQSQKLELMVHNILVLVYVTEE